MFNRRDIKKNSNPELGWSEFFLNFSERSKMNRRKYLIQDRLQYARDHQAHIISPYYLGLVLDQLPPTERLLFANEKKDILSNGTAIQVILEFLDPKERFEFVSNQVAKIRDFHELSEIKKYLTEVEAQQLQHDFDKKSQYKITFFGTPKELNIPATNVEMSRSEITRLAL